MDTLQVAVLALIQGLTEFLPISSSAHLILVPVLTDWPDQGLAFDVAVHVGSLIAVVGYFRGEVITLLRDWLRSLAEGRRVGESPLAWAVLIGTVPAALAGLALDGPIEQHLRSPRVIALATLGFGLLLWWTDQAGRRERDEHDLTWRDALLIGCAQALALIPGTSRSGITMTAGLALGLTREATARFSFLLAIPLIALAGGYKTVQLMEAPVPADWNALALGTFLSALSAWACIHLFLKWVARSGMLPFVVYRLLLGTCLLWLFA
jgi:undecaprenyl-diphosphatase